jgi:serine protease
MATAQLTLDRPLPPAAKAPTAGSRASAAALVAALILALLAGLAVTGVFARVFADAGTSAAVSASAAAAAALPYEPHELVVGYSGSLHQAITEIRTITKVDVTVSPRASFTPNEVVLQLPEQTAVPTLAAEVKALPNVSYAVPDYIAHIAGQWFPDDTGRTDRAKGWEKLQWNFLAKHGVAAPAAWANLIADHRPGAKGVTIAVVDTGIAFRDWRTFKRSPDFRGTKFVDPCDLVVGNVRDGRCTNPYALDRESHGTFVAGTIAESTNNNFSLTGLAYGASIMPVRVLDADGNGDASTIAAGIRYAVQHGAQVVNLSIEFSPGTTLSEIPDVNSAIAYAHDHGAIVVGAAGNDEDTSIDYPAALANVVSVGATTIDRCLAAYSDIGKGLDLVAPGGGDDAASVPGSVCHPGRALPDIYQMTFNDSVHPSVFSLPGGWFGTSMAAPDVSAAAAMVIASGVIGAHPSPNAILARLEATAHPLGSGTPNNYYGFGLINIGAATAKGGPVTPVTTTSTTTTPTTTTAPYTLPGAPKGGVPR